MTDCLAQEDVEIYGHTPVSDKGRQAEIEYYIRRNHVQKYIVIDDDPGLFQNPQDLNLFVPDYKKGLDEKDIKKIHKSIYDVPYGEEGIAVKKENQGLQPEKESGISAQKNIMDDEKQNNNQANPIVRRHRGR